ncbi:MAG TPA: S9 family peptidase, partial [Acidobacteria bacterium]|nr:S9 family peptidase [Acidobacteriota bacterium]
MPSHLHRATAALFLALSLLAAPRGAAGAGRPITETDLFRFVWIADPQISPDGRQIVFVRVTVDKKQEGYDTALWIVPADGGAPARPFTFGRRDLSPRWSPDGRQVAFVRGSDRPEEGRPQIHLISASGGEAFAVTDLPGGASSPAWSPDGKTLAFLSTTNDRDLAKKNAQGEAERESDVRVITRAVYRQNGAGYNDPTRPSHVWTVAVPAPGDAPAAPVQLTRGGFSEDDPAWSPDGAFLYFSTLRVEEPYYEMPNRDVWAVPAAGGDMRAVVDVNGLINDWAIAPGGGRMAFAGVLNPAKRRSYEEVDLLLTDLKYGAPVRNLTERVDGDVADDLSADQHAPRGERPRPVVWSADGRSLITVVAERGRTNLKRFSVATGAVEPLTTGDHEISAWSATPDAARLALVVSTPTRIGDLYAFDVATKRMKLLYEPNRELLAEIALTPPEEIVYESFDGRPIHAFVQKPADFDPAKKYPLILNIHGGPHAAYGFVFFHEFQWLAAQGYVVLYPNPRGSSSYGQDFGNVIQLDFPGDDAKDLLAGVDEMVKRPYIDAQRLGVTGGSGGGILTNWILVQDRRFKAAVSQRSIADWAGFWYTADFSLFDGSWFRGA